jgi:hypothetical protein
MKASEAQQLYRRSEAAWFAAQDFTDLLQLNIQFLSCRIVVHPQVHPSIEDIARSKYPGQCEETSAIRSRLIEINRFGFFTEQSQPGLVQTGPWGIICQRAFVDGFVTKQTAYALAEIRDVGCDVIVGSKNKRVAVTTQASPGKKPKPFTWVGYGTSASDYRNRIGASALADDLRTHVFVAVYDRVWNRNNVLWNAVLAVLKR